MAEAAYGLKKDINLSLQNFFNRRIFKIIAGVNLIFTLLDIINKDHNKYTIADDIYLTVSSVLLFVTLLELRAVAQQTRARYDALLANYAPLREPLQLEERKEEVEATIIPVEEPTVVLAAGEENNYTRLQM